MKAEHGRRYSRACRLSFACEVPLLRTPLAHPYQRCRRPHLCPRDRDFNRKAERINLRVDPCRSPSTFRAHYANSPRDAAPSRSRNQLQLWLRHCRPCGLFTPVFEIASQPSKARCEHINIFVGDENIRYTGGLATKLAS
jgi:hypothetical protein